MYFQSKFQRHFKSAVLSLSVASLAACTVATGLSPQSTESAPSSSSVPTQTQQIAPVTSANQNLKPWVFGDPAIGDATNDYLYFVGQSAINVAARGSVPPRSSFESAKANARSEYVRYMGNLIQSKTNEALRGAGDDIEGQQTVAALKTLSKQFAQRTVTGLAPFDSEYQSSGRNASGIPLWKAWVRMRIKKETVRNKFGTLSKNVQKSAMKGVKRVQKMATAIRKVEKAMVQGDDFFKGF